MAGAILWAKPLIWAKQPRGLRGPIRPLSIGTSHCSWLEARYMAAGHLQGAGHPVMGGNGLSRPGWEFRV